MTQNFAQQRPDVEHRDAMNTETSPKGRNRLTAIQVVAVLTVLALAATGVTAGDASTKSRT